MMKWLQLLALTGFSLILAFIIVLLLKLIQISKEIKVKVQRRRGRRSAETQKQLKKGLIQKEKFSCAFFHPNCSAGGGGERTLFAAIISLKSKFPSAQLTLFIKADTKHQESISEIKKKAMDDFNLEIPSDIRLIPLKSVFLAESSTWPRFTLLGQIIGSIVLAFESMIRFRPDLLIDTAGFPFIYPIISKIFNCKLVAYVHYPFISTDMIQKLQTKAFNNSGHIASNSVLRNCKIMYYKTLVKLYSFCGSCCNLALTNSSWTNGHMIRLWNNCPNIKIVYPPCDLSPFTAITRTKTFASPLKVLSLSQFRPEKNHRLQLEIAAKVLKTDANIQFVFVGGCRGSEDENRVKELNEYAEQLNISRSIQFKLNLPFNELLEHLKMSSIGLHTMTDEHFGIGIVELMAAGLITIAHNSGGPRADIIKKGEGFLCSSASEYSETILKIASMNDADRIKIIEKAKSSSISRFSGDIFQHKFSENLFNIMQ